GVGVVTAEPGAHVEIIVRKPGYLSVQRTAMAGEPATKLELELDSVIRFQGVWRLASGELRAFERHDERVDVSKLDEVSGPRHFYRHYSFAPADAGIAFGGDEEIVDPRAPDEPSCHVAVHVEYRYDQTLD